MTLGIIKRTTLNYSFRIPFFDAPNWGREVERNFDTIDAVLFAATGLTNIKGVWTNDTEYDASDRVVDPADGSVWQANVDHTSAVTGSFSDDRTLHPTYWTVLSVSLNNRGQWTTATNYNVNEFVYDDHRYGTTKTKYISGATYDIDVAAGNIVTLIDIRDAYDDSVANAASAAASAASAAIDAANADADAAAALASKNAAAASAAAALVSETNADNSEAGALASATAAAISAADAAANGLTVSMFNFSTTVAYPPSSGQVRLNNATQGSATRVDVSHINTGGIDVTQTMLLQVQAGTLILLQDRATPANYQIYTATGPAVVSGSDLQIPVVWKSGGTAIANNRPTLFAIGGGGGAASVTTDDNPPAAPLRDGQLWFKSSTGVFYVYYDDGNTSQWVQISAAPQVAAQSTRNKGFIDPGFNLANDTTDATNDILFPTGVVASDVAPYPLMSHDATIRQLDVVFDTNNTDRRGGRFSSAAISDGTWHCFIISNGTLTKSGFSKNLNPTADDLYPAGYTHYRRVASWNRLGGVLNAVKQRGNKFQFVTPPVMLSSSAAFASTAINSPVPTGIEVELMLQSAMQATTGTTVNILIGDGWRGNTAVVMQTLNTNSNAEVDIAMMIGGVFTNTLTQIYMARTIAIGTVVSHTVSCLGWIDTRGTE